MIDHSMQRSLSQFFKDWMIHPGRKPLIVRGARQVGKTWLVRELAKTSGHQLVELNSSMPWSMQTCVSHSARLRAKAGCLPACMRVLSSFFLNTA